MAPLLCLIKRDLTDSAYCSGLHCVKSTRIRNFSGPYFPTETYSVSLRIHSECGKIRTRKTPNTDTFYAALDLRRQLALG